MTAELFPEHGPAERRADLVIHAARLLTMAPMRDERPRVGPAAGDVGIVDDGWLAARDGTILATGRGGGWDAYVAAGDVDVVDADGRVVMPGFVDPHTHLCYAGERWDEFIARRSGTDYLAALETGGGIHATVRATRETDDDQLRALVRERVARAAALGTTTIEIKSGYGLEPEEELRQLRIIGDVRADAPIDVAPTYLAAHALPRGRGTDRAAFIRDAASVLAGVAAEQLAEAVDAFVEHGVFEVDDVKPLFSTARKLGLRITMHADQLNDVGAAQYAARMDASSADHLANTNAAGLAALARAGTVAVLLPGSAFFVGYDPPDARRFIAQRVPVALATDQNPGTSPLEGMATAVALGVTLCRLTPHEAIVAATINAAHALGRGDRTGALVRGRRSDVVVLDTDDERELAYRIGARIVREVYAAGKRVVQ